MLLSVYIFGGTSDRWEVRRLAAEGQTASMDTCETAEKGFLFGEKTGLGDAECNLKDISANVEKLGWQGGCLYVSCVESCLPEDGFVNYMKLPFCSMQGSVAGAVPVLILWLFVLFLALGLVADNFFCPCLASVSDSLGLSDNVAGVTLLALGNGAPDLFSTYSAIQSNTEQNEAAALAIGEMFGAGMFVVAIVVSALVCMAGGFRISRRPFLRDLLVYLLAVIWLLVVFWDGDVSLLESLLCIGLYIVYVLAVAIGGKVYEYMQKNKQQLDESPEPTGETESEGTEIPSRESAAPVTAMNSLVSRFSSYRSYVPESESEIGTNEIDSAPAGGSLVADESEWQVLCRRVRPMSQEEFLSHGYLQRALDIFQAPLLLLLKATILYVDCSEEDRGWSRYLKAFQVITSCSIIIFGCNVAFVNVGAGVPLLVPVLGSAVIIAVLVLCLTNGQPPRWHTAFAYLAFAVCMVCSYVIANELVNVLQVLGEILGISNAILGATVLAWGNSIGDLVSNSAMAKNGFPRMAFGACFGGPALNVLLGMGLASVVKTASSEGGHYVLNTESRMKLQFSGIFLAAMLASLFVVVPIAKFRIGRGIAIYLSILYLTFLAVIIAFECLGSRSR